MCNAPNIYNFTEMALRCFMACLYLDYLKEIINIITIVNTYFRNIAMWQSKENIYFSYDMVCVSKMLLCI